jgi:hypothetical protein
VRLTERRVALSELAYLLWCWAGRSGYTKEVLMSRSLLRHRIVKVVGIVTVLAMVPLGVMASHGFDDVPDSNIFHGSIDWLVDNGITLGCNPPTNTNFCPKDNVTREQMAALMRRQAQAFGQAGAQVPSSLDRYLVDRAAYIGLLTIDIAPKADATVTLNTHVTLEKPVTTEGRYEVAIVRGGCNGTVLADGVWQPIVEPTGTVTIDVVSLTAFDSVSADTSYTLCVRKMLGPDATAFGFGLTATWMPTS